MDVSKNRGNPPKMNGENNGKNPLNMGWFGGFPIIFGLTPIYVCASILWFSLPTFTGFHRPGGRLMRIGSGGSLCVRGPMQTWAAVFFWYFGVVVCWFGWGMVVGWCLNYVEVVGFLFFGDWRSQKMGSRRHGNLAVRKKRMTNRETNVRRLRSRNLLNKVSFVNHYLPKTCF